jgi:hypothetical protein
LTLVPRRRSLGRARMLEFLNGLEDTVAGPSLTLYLPPAAEPESALEALHPPAALSAQAIQISDSSPTGAVVFLNDGRLRLVLPPFPVSSRSTSQMLETGPLRSLLAHDYLIGLVLVRLGSYALGIAGGEKLLTSKVGTGLVHGRHRQGGSSAHRFERHRDKQIEYFFTRVCRHAREQIEPYVKSIDYLAYGGARTTIRLLLKQCGFLGRMTAPTLPPLLDIPEPRRAVLEDAVKRVYSGTVIEWEES